MNRTKVVVSRRWQHGAEIEAFATDQEVGAHMVLKDFIIALADEMNDIGVARDDIKRALQGACQRVVREMKAQTRFVVGK